MKPAIRFTHVSKRYRLGLGLKSLRSTVVSLATRGKRNGSNELWALRDVNFEIMPGEAVGLVGQNGAGKSTALRLIAGITRPTSGKIEVEGRISTLLELGAGFHHELTGRENIFLYGSILGLKNREIQQAFDSIVAFSELERFLDTPLKRYSSGMYVRLAFSVAAHIKPDILLVDEVLAVGDAAFRQKCMERMDEMRQGGVTLVFVSHNALMVQTVCERGLYFSQGKLMVNGDVEEVIHEYENDLRKGRDFQRRRRKGDAPESWQDHGVVSIEDIRIADLEDQEKETFGYDDGARICVSYQAHAEIQSPVLHVRLWRDDGTPCFTVRSNQKDALVKGVNLDGRGEFALRVSPLQLYGGTYRAEVVILDCTNTIRLARGYSPWFHVSGPGSFSRERMGIFVPNSAWEFDGVTVDE